MKQFLCTKNLILIALALTALTLTIIMSYLYSQHPSTAQHITDNHLRHYIAGILAALLISAVLNKKLTLLQHITYVFLPLLIASGWPDIIYFLSYLIQEGTYIGVLTNKNAVYYFMHHYLPALSAGPIITATVMIYDKKKPIHYWYWPLIMLLVTASLSALHVLLDRHFGF